MKIIKEKWFLPVILVISIMAIIITANQIYNILSNDKILDNSVSGIQGEEDNYDADYGIVSQEINIQLYQWKQNGSGTNINNYLIDKYEDNDEIYNISVSEETDGDYLTITLPFTINEKVSRLTIYSKNKGFINQYTINSNNIELSNTNVMNYDSYEQSYNGETNFTINISRKKILDKVNHWFYPELTFYIEANYYNVTQSKISYGESKFYNLPYNELLQSNIVYSLGSTYILNHDTGEYTKLDISKENLSKYIFDELTNDWKKGKETATILCSIGEYYNDGNELAISTKNNDLPMMFNIGDIVIPYIPTARGGTEPMSIKLDGTPKIFQVTQVRPYFDGACWQELQLQEYGDKQYNIVTREYIFTSGNTPDALNLYSFSGDIVINDINVIGIWIADNYYEEIKGASSITKKSNTTYTVEGLSIKPNDSVPVNIGIKYEV